MSAEGVSGFLACTKELLVLNKIGVVSAVIVRSGPRYRAFSDGLLDWDFRLEGHQVWREIQFEFWDSDSMIPINYIKEATFWHFLPCI